MSDAQPQRSMGRSVWALVVGFLVVVILSLGTDVALRAGGILAPLGHVMSDGLFALVTAYRVVYGVIGSYITARLAPNKPMQHSLLGGVIGIGLGTLGAAATWNKGPEFGPHWYPLALILLSMPQSWLGAKIRLLQMGGTAP